MKTATATKVAAQFNDYLEASRQQPVVVTRNGKPVAVLISVRNRSEAERISRGQPRSLRSIFQEATEQIEQHGAIPFDQFWQEVAQRRAAQRKPRARTKRAE